MKFILAAKINTIYKDVLTALYVMVRAVCRLPVAVGPCEAAYQKWYFEPESALCVEFEYGGCEGNANRFSSKEECKRTCHELLKTIVGECRGVGVAHVATSLPPPARPSGVRRASGFFTVPQPGFRSLLIAVTDTFWIL